VVVLLSKESSNQQWVLSENTATFAVLPDSWQIAGKEVK